MLCPSARRGEWVVIRHLWHAINSANGCYHVLGIRRLQLGSWRRDTQQLERLKSVDFVLDCALWMNGGYVLYNQLFWPSDLFAQILTQALYKRQGPFRATDYIVPFSVRS